MQKNEISPVEQPSEEKEIEKKVHTYPSSSSRGPKNWDRIAKEAEEEEKNEKYDGDQAVNRLFQQIYADSSDEVKKAMMKSFTESKGTVLSTNWDEVKRDKVDCKPPSGMEFKKW
uniref:SGS domain-containing protein n=1 Tax=Romanomermis culicivorax TaxID=13658 RepID=A0A915IUW4_ROMCU